MYALTKNLNVAVMRNKTPLLLIGSLVLVVLASCSKEKSVDTSGGSGGGSTGSEKGTWNIVNMRGITNSTITLNDGVDEVKTVTISDYTTQNNGGTIKFDGSTMTGTGITYSVDDIATAYFYTNGVLEDSLDAPFAASIPPTDSKASYKKIGSDSIYVQSGVFTSVGSGGTTQSSAGGYKLKFDGDKMTMTAAVNQTKVELNMGITQRTISQAVQIITLQKQ
jgi:hypothetical protein